METASSLQRCTRLALSQPTRRTLISSNPSRVVTHVMRSPFRNTIEWRQNFSSSPKTLDSAPQQPPSKPAPARPSIKDLLRDLRQRDEPRTTQSMGARMDALMGKRPHGAGAGAGRTEAGTATSRIDNFADIMGPAGGVDQDRMLEELSQEVHDGPSISLRLGPTLGRTVGGLYGDASRGFRVLQNRCNSNSVKFDAYTQLRHVRRGQRKKDLRRSRWRALFKEGFVAECARVRRMRKQGW